MLHSYFHRSKGCPAINKWVFKCFITGAFVSVLISGQQSGRQRWHWKPSFERYSRTWCVMCLARICLWSSDKSLDVHRSGARLQHHLDGSIIDCHILKLNINEKQHLKKKKSFTSILWNYCKLINLDACNVYKYTVIHQQTLWLLISRLCSSLLCPFTHFYFFCTLIISAQIKLVNRRKCLLQHVAQQLKLFAAEQSQLRSSLPGVSGGRCSSLSVLTYFTSSLLSSGTSPVSVVFAATDKSASPSVPSLGVS